MKTNNNFHILIVDDEKLNIELASFYLKEEGYKLSFALNGSSALLSVKNKDIDLILLDINMPKQDGFEVCKILKSQKKTEDIPIVFLTAQTDINYISKAFEVGGADYINKPFNGIELKIRVKTQLQNISYLQEIKNKQSKLAQLSITDNLTKLYNSLYFDSLLKVSITNKEKHNWIIYFQLDRFEKVNQLYGFYASNKIIKQFAKTLQESAPQNSVVAKMYGASFGVFVKGSRKETIEQIAREIGIKLRNDKKTKKLIYFHTVVINLNENSTLVNIYKKIQDGIYSIKDKDTITPLMIK